MYTETTTGLAQEQVYADNPIMGEETDREWTPTRAELLREYAIQIEFLSVGCLIKVGCKTIPFTTIAEGMAELNAYVGNPVNTKQKWEKIFKENK
jgi:hypothetical protein